MYLLPFELHAGVLPTYMPVYSAYMCVLDAHGGQNECQSPCNRSLWAVTWVLGTEPRSSEKIASALNFCDISSAPSKEHIHCCCEESTPCLVSPLAGPNSMDSSSFSSHADCCHHAFFDFFILSGASTNYSAGPWPNWNRDLYPLMRLALAGWRH